ncbi:energy transducer TonB [Pontibacter cellulosilyticus]|uniref:Energy transducer TonB n=1 Tax=Pontibacter cellulosilyticus TaxID=1720253 RepID=A0A923N7P3_9BACT|nr:energy transducer TonB [Pontibacter cellulosilyticus]MBC5993297.1 energy transducer TonB [Pontibacter cellulosilyticus]
MMKHILLFILLVIPAASMAQETSERYFKDQSLRKETPKEKAAYAKIETRHADGSVTNAVKNLRKDEIIRSQTYRGAEPVGVWIIQYGSGPKPIDYNFTLEYSGDQCIGAQKLIISDYFADNDSIGYKAPKIATGEKSFNYFLGTNIVYPAGALREGIQGTVLVNFTITKDGKIEDITVQQGKHLLLDKEAVRVIRKLKLASPPTLSGKAQDFCVTAPVGFRMM